jgi:hypothetical protein
MNTKEKKAVSYYDTAFFSLQRHLDARRDLLVIPICFAAI